MPNIPQAPGVPSLASSLLHKPPKSPTPESSAHSFPEVLQPGNEGNQHKKGTPVEQNSHGPGNGPKFSNVSTAGNKRFVSEKSLGGVGTASLVAMSPFVVLISYSPTMFLSSGSEVTVMCPVSLFGSGPTSLQTSPTFKAQWWAPNQPANPSRRTVPKTMGRHSLSS